MPTLDLSRSTSADSEMNLVLEDQPQQEPIQGPPQITCSPISVEFDPESPHSRHLHPRVDFPLAIARSRSGSDLKATRSKSNSRARTKSLLRFFTRGDGKEVEEPLPPLPLSPARSDIATVPTPPPQIKKTESEEDKTSKPSPASVEPIQTLSPPPHSQLQRKRSIFDLFKRANTLDPSMVVSSPTSLQPQPQPGQKQTLSRSKSMFISVRKSVFGLSLGASGSFDGVKATTAGASPSSLRGNTKKNLSRIRNEDEDEKRTPSPSVLSSSTTNTPAQPATSENSNSSQLTTPSGTPRPKRARAKGIGMSLILNPKKERKSFSPLRSAPPTIPDSRRSPRSSSFLPLSSLSPPTSPTKSSLTSKSHSSLRSREMLGRKGVNETEGLLSVWGEFLVGGGEDKGQGEVDRASSTSTACEEAEEENEVSTSLKQEAQVVSPTIGNEASRLVSDMSNIEDDETRWVTEVAFM